MLMELEMIADADQSRSLQGNSFDKLVDDGVKRTCSLATRKCLRQAARRWRGPRSLQGNSFDKLVDEAATSKKRLL